MELRKVNLEFDRGRAIVTLPVGAVLVEAQAYSGVPGVTLMVVVDERETVQSTFIFLRLWPGETTVGVKLKAVVGPVSEVGADMQANQFQLPARSYLFEIE